jgi:heptosyltransferase I
MAPTPVEDDSASLGEASPSASDRPGRSFSRSGGPPPADRVLVIRLGAVGDVVRTLPSVAALRSLYPGAHLAWLVEPASAGVVDAAGLVDETMIFPRPQLLEAMREGDALRWGRLLIGFVRTLRQRRFEVVLDFHGLLKSGVLSRLSGAPMRYGYDWPLGREGSFLFATRHVAKIDPSVSRFERNAALVRVLAPSAPIPTGPMLRPSALAKARLTARLRAAGRERSRGFALIHPGSSAGAQHKRYARSAWVKVVHRLADNGIEVWIAAGPNRYERSLAESIVRESTGACVLAPETRSFDDLLALQSRAGVFIANDSGPLHAASLSGVPVVQLMGPTHPQQNEPWPGTPVRRLRVPLPCSPCRRGCADPTCMRAIPPASVAEAAQELLSSVLENRVGRQDAKGGRVAEPGLQSPRVEPVG